MSIFGISGAFQDQGFLAHFQAGRRSSEQIRTVFGFPGQLTVRLAAENWERATFTENMMAIKPQLKALLFLSFPLLAMAGNAARAENIPIVTGQQWVSSSEGEKKAYLVGISNLLDVERAYAGNAAKSDDIAQRFGKGMQGQTLDSVRQSLDNYYAANPTMVQHPVIETLWFQVVAPGTKKRQ